MEDRSSGTRAAEPPDKHSGRRHMANRETGKQRKSRIPLDYYKRSDPLARVKKVLGWGAAVVAFAYLATGLLRGDSGRLSYSRGDVAAAHATWDANCAACHEPLSPVDSNSWLKDFPLTSWMVTQKATNMKCQACHSGAAHSSLEKPGETASCAFCHRDHRGRDAAIARVPDHDCTVCHADLSAHRTSSGVVADNALKVTGFTASTHPPFASIPSEDKSALKFNHKIHMLPSFGSDRYTPQYFKDRLSERDQNEFGKRYGESATIQLTCASCHQLDPGDFAIDPALRHMAGATPTRPSGEYMLPITYENQCRHCHMLDFTAGEPAPPHGLEPADLRRFLEGAFARKFLQGDSKVLEETAVTRRMPGRSVEEGKQTARQDINDQIAQAEMVLYQDRCAKCHSFSEERLDAAETAFDAPKSVLPTAVPNIWLKHSKFNHGTHRAVSCDACHGLESEGKFGPVATSEFNTDVLFTKVDVCQKCHARPSGGSTPTGGARHDCTECHRYHNGDNPLHGIGAFARAGTTDRSVADFIAAAGASTKSTAQKSATKSNTAAEPAAATEPATEPDVATEPAKQ